MGDDSPAEEGADPSPGAVDELVGYNQVAGFYLPLKAPCRADGDDVLYPQRFQGIDISPRRQLTGRDAVPPAVPGQEGNPHPFQPADGDGITRLAEGRINISLFNVSQPLNIIKPRPADNSNLCLRH